MSTKLVFTIKWWLLIVYNYCSMYILLIRIWQQERRTYFYSIYTNYCLSGGTIAGGNQQSITIFRHYYYKCYVWIACIKYDKTHKRPL